MRLTLLVTTVCLALGLTSCSSHPEPSQSAQTGAVAIVSPEDLADSMDITDPPRVELIREITPGESEEVYSQCLSEAGWTLTRSDEAGDSYFDIPASQQEAFALSRYTCILQYPVAERFTRELTEEQFGILYDYWTERTVPCFTELGYDVGEVPTLETFLADPSWHPAIAIQDQISADVRSGRWEDFDHAMYEVCPGPPDDLLYGSGR